jgi:hypothetical protein
MKTDPQHCLQLYFYLLYSLRLMWGTQRKKRRAKKRNRAEVDFNVIVREEGEDQREISVHGAADAFLRKSSRTRYNDFDLF